MSDLTSDAIKAKEASRLMAVLSTETKDKALAGISRALLDSSESIFEANREDIGLAEKTGLETPLLKRLKFDEAKLKDVRSGIEGLIGLEDPVGKKLLHTTLYDGLELYKVTCPIGVIGVIFESRPDALVQIASLCVKSGNAVFLKGGREADKSNRALASVIYDAGVRAGLPEGWLHLITTREDVNNMLSLGDYIDLIIPRGSNSFVQYIMQNTTIPVMGHADGVCHTFIDRDADIETAVKVTVDAKTQYVSVCNATETILIDSAVKDQIVPVLYPALREKGVEIFEEDQVTDWHHEYLDYKVSVKFVSGVREAVDHINKYGSGHTDAIITKNMETAEFFMDSVDSGSVLLNCSTRFADGFRYGFGAEVGISTSKLHARGPVGLEGLVSYKFKLYGSGDTVGEFASGIKTFKHIRRDDI